MPEIPTAPEAPATHPVTTGNAGFKTTEFWMSILAALGAVMASVGGVLPQPWGMVLVTVSGAAYAVSRGLAKSG